MSKLPDQTQDASLPDSVLGRYRQRADLFEAKVGAVREDQWTNQSPCDDWDARDVVRHIVIMHDAMLHPLGRNISLGPSVDEDPLAAFRSARRDIEKVLLDETLAGFEFDNRFLGRRTVALEIDSVVSADMVLHGWDLARATGQDDHIDEAELELVIPSMSSLPENILRMPGVLGPRFPVAADAPLQHKVLGFLGRDPGWRSAD